MGQVVSIAGARPAPTRRPARMKRTAAATIIGLLLLIVGAIGGFALANHKSRLAVRSGVPTSSVDQISLVTPGWVYNVPLDTEWFSADGTVNDGSRPACLLPTARAPVSFATVTVSGRGMTWRPVVWVQC